MIYTFFFILPKIKSNLQNECQLIFIGLNNRRRTSSLYCMWFPSRRFFFHFFNIYKCRVFSANPGLPMCKNNDILRY